MRLPETHLDHGIKPAIPFSKMVGPAVTVRLEPAPNPRAADLTPLIRAYESQPESSGAVMVIQVPPELHERGIFGGGAATMARRHGFVGALIEGAARDTHELREMRFPAFSRAVSPGYIVDSVSVAAVDGPVLVGGRTIHAGDVIAADNDGVVVIRPPELNDVAALARAVKEWEHRRHSMAAGGKTYEEINKITGPMPQPGHIRSS